MATSNPSNSQQQNGISEKAAQQFLSTADDYFRSEIKLVASDYNCLTQMNETALDKYNQMRRKLEHVNGSIRTMNDSNCTKMLSTRSQLNEIEDAMSNLESTIMHLDAYSRSLETQMLQRLIFSQFSHCRFLSSVPAWREKISQGPSLKSFIEQTVNQAPSEPTLPPYLTQHNIDDYEPLDPLKHPKRRVYFDVYGCQMNDNDTDIAYTFLDKHGGYERVSNEDDADIVLLMTCSIREGAEQKIWKKLQSLGNRKRTRSPYAPPFQIGVLGCMAERLKEKLIEREKIVDVVCGPDAYRSLPNLLDQTLLMSDQKGINTVLSLDETYADITPLRFDINNRRAFVSIMRGCNNMCTFCIVPFTRGRERSRPMSSILDELRYLADLGIKDVTLLGQNVNSYCDKSEMNVSLHTTKSLSRGFRENYKTNIAKGSIRFATLLDQASQISPELRIRFTSPHPKDFPDDLLYVMRDRSNICKSIHLPCQSGSTRMLELMRRGYTKESYLLLVEHIRSIMPDLSFSSDFIAGFCSETDDDHRDTLDVINRVRYNFIYSFPYSMREKTKAHYHLNDDIPPDIKSRRHLEIHELFRHHAHLINQSYIGQTQLCLVEGPSKRSPDTEVAGRNDYNTKVIFSKQLSESNEIFQPGDYVEVRIDSATSQSLKGTALKRRTLADFNSLKNTCC
ncbi:unnamed protein product [Rotaria socialis]|uniref:CDK5RAP1-like protein n=3 Tax=Rotaria socialis TaxID=392032 RepID=A0A820XZ87_9BILA|nr:unnamed protein product [Rotaria socialis]CAF4365955.1 unnamed protein product [Rotaria socialis]CAF4447757.1 unnamed protein product [Rotaria socialis]CAF4540457.1 unnamed protein product [Rotaria socialis]CAF4586609.1 unnamed protein product [Rotaria socialis]